MNYTDYTTADHNLFMALNFDGGACWDRVMLTISATTTWLPLYALILYLVYRQAGLRNMLIFLVAVGAAIGLSDVIASIFKANGLLGSLLSDLQPRLRPMFNPNLEGLAITADSMVTLRHALLPTEAAVHVPKEAVAGLYGTVSAHAATIVSLSVLSSSVIRRWWFTILMVIVTLLICYSRIYLGKHFPLDLLWGAITGGGVAYAMLVAYRRFTRR